jgi:uncharacterized protein (TIGR02145 family)
MNKLFKFSGIILIIIIFYSCKENPVPPSLSTTNATEITTTTAVSGGVITDDGGAQIIASGVCWNTSDNPTIENNKTIESGGSASFISNISLLSPGTSYYVRAYATNSAGTSYGKSVSFKTLGDKPSSNTLPVSNIQLTSATLHGSVNPNSLSTTVNFEWGTTTSYGNTVTPAQSPLTGNSSVIVTADLSGLASGTTYHVRIKVENSLGVTYSSDLIFKTLGDPPSATISSASNIQVRSSTLNGSVNPNYLVTAVIFEWGITASYGNTVTSSQSPLTGSSNVNVNADLSGLKPGTTYHYRIRATNLLGTTNSPDMTFLTLGQIPTTIALTATNLQYTTATLNGSVNPNYLNSTISFEWGTTLDYGNNITPVNNNIPAGNTAVSVSIGISGLNQGTTYHFRVVAANELGTSYSNDLTFTTLEPISDIEGNHYNIKTLGTQIWMTDNLKTTRYNNGDIIGTTTPALLVISGESTPKYQWSCDGNESNVAIYGRLYTWFTATDPRNVCPTGWHIPTDYEWTALTDYLTNNGYGYGGSGSHIAKSIASTSLWLSDPTLGAPGKDQPSNNASGFNGLPGGIRSDDSGEANFSLPGGSTAWWSSTELTSTVAWQRLLIFNNPDVVRSYFGGKKNAVAVRCIKN